MHCGCRGHKTVNWDRNFYALVNTKKFYPIVARKAARISIRIMHAPDKCNRKGTNIHCVHCVKFSSVQPTWFTQIIFRRIFSWQIIEQRDTHKYWGVFTYFILDLVRIARILWTKQKHLHSLSFDSHTINFFIYIHSFLNSYRSEQYLNLYQHWKYIRAFNWHPPVELLSHHWMTASVEFYQIAQSIQSEHVIANIFSAPTFRRYRKWSECLLFFFHEVIESAIRGKIIITIWHE